MYWLTIIMTISIDVIIFYSIFKFLKKRKKLKLNFKGRHPKLKKIGCLLILLITGGSIIFLSYNISNRFAFIRLNLSGYYEWRESNGQDYLYVEANEHYDLGYHTGHALSWKIVQMKYLLFFGASFYGLNYFNLIEMSNQYLKKIPEDYQKEILGVSEGASQASGFYISFSDILIQNLFFEILYGRHEPTTLELNSDFGCTAFGANNTDSTMIIGQTMDLLKPMGLVQSFVLHKLNNEPLIFSYRLGGALALPMAKNENGLTIVFNLVQTNIISPIITPTFVLIREGLSSLTSVKDFKDYLFPNNQSSFCRNFIICNNTLLLSIQALPEIQEIKNINATITTSNTYLNTEWENYLKDPKYSKERQVHAETRLLEAYNDNILSDSELLDIFKDEPIIYRNEEGLFGVGTLSFMTTNSFGFNSPGDSNQVGVIPI